jgi:hypothetical protein
MRSSVALPSADTSSHEAAHVAAARCLGFSPTVTFHSPVWDDGIAALTHLGPGDRSPLNLTIVSYAPSSRLSERTGPRRRSAVIERSSSA